MGRLSEKQKRFVEEYLIDLNATQASIRAGYRKSEYTDTNANKLLGNTRIKEAIEKAMAERSRRTGITQDRVLRELAKLAFVNAGDIIDGNDASIKDDASRDDLACVQSVKVKTMENDKGTMTEREVKLYDKKASLELLGKHLGLFNDNLNVNGSLTLPVVIKDDIPDED